MSSQPVLPVLLLLCLVNHGLAETYEEQVIVSDVGGDGRHVVVNMTLGGQPVGGVYKLWNKWWVQMVEAAGVEEVQVSMVRGVWRWGGGGRVLAPPALSVVARFSPDVDRKKSWDVLVNSLSTVTCASTNFLSSKTDLDYALPFILTNFSNSWDAWGSLPYEEMLCTENLTPLLSLLPTKGATGSAPVHLTPKSFFNTRYHALHLAYSKGKQSMSVIAEGVYLKQDFTMPHPDIECGVCDAPVVVKYEKNKVEEELSVLEVFSSDKGDSDGVLNVRISPGTGVGSVELTLLMPLLLLQPYVSTLEELGDDGETWRKVERYRTEKVGNNVLKILLAVSTPSERYLRLRFDKRLLPLASYPPDANRNYYLPPSFITTSPGASPIYNKRPAGITLPTPDFSMPFNIITLGCTALALIFGMGFNPATKDFPSKEKVE